MQKDILRGQLVCKDLANMELVGNSCSACGQLVSNGLANWEGVRFFKLRGLDILRKLVGVHKDS